MQHVLTPYSTAVQPYAWWQGAFTESQLDWLQQQAKQADIEAKVGNKENGGINHEIRRSELGWLNKQEDTSWVFETLSHVASTLNADYFNFDLTGFSEALQMTNYHESKQGNYIWHQDFGSAGPSRKLSMVVQLSDPSEYEGGELQIMTGHKPTTIKKERGFICVFPAWTLHQVTPVTKGTRQTLVTWLSGPKFK